MEALEEQIEWAKNDRDSLNKLISDYLPFIKSQVSRLQLPALEQEDAQSIAMLVFTSCIQQYRPGRGGFLAFAQTCIRNRLIDESRKQSRGGAVLSLSGEDALSAEDSASLQRYDKELERRELCAEIDEFSARLAPFGLTFAELSRVCPKHRKARVQCIEIARAIVEDSAMRSKLLQQQRLSQSELAEQFHISVKTIEKHRKYIAAVVLLLTGDYPGIQAFLPRWKEVDE